MNVFQIDEESLRILSKRLVIYLSLFCLIFVYCYPTKITFQQDNFLQVVNELISLWKIIY
jgi:hypothetical protein